jgi:3-methylfumaryl-CoA hydratase
MKVEIHRSDIVKYSIATEQRLEKYLSGDEAPPMFLFGALRSLVPMDELGPDGIAIDAFLPDLPLKRVMAGGTETRYHRTIKPGDTLVATRTLSDIIEKQGSTGPLIFLKYELKVATESGEPVVDEIVTRIVR